MPTSMTTQCDSDSPLDVEDIEDLFSNLSDDVNAVRRRNRHNIVLPKVKKKLRETKPDLCDVDVTKIEDENLKEISSFLPGYFYFKKS